jgi:nucleolar protein 56
MKAKIVTTIIGCFGVSEKDKIVSYVEFPKDADKIVDLLNESKTKMIKQEKDVKADLEKKGYTDIVKGDSTYVTSNLRKLAIEEKFVKTPMDFNKIVSKVNIKLAKTDIKQAISRDQLVMQANNSIDEMDKSINIMVERMREWYGLHFPEMDRTIADHRKFAKLIEKFGARSEFDHPELGHFKEKSMGADFKKEDVKIMQKFASEILDLYRIRDDTADYMEKVVKEVAPNLRDIAGPVLAAKLISLAGGLEKLARMPSSTIQLLGAEKALFRHLHGRGKSPKHGIIVSHPFVKNAPLKNRGKIARLLASKFSIAAKMDFYSKEYKGKELKKEIEKKVKEISK